MQARGLKPFLKQQLNYRDYVAPHAGAWIETIKHRQVYFLYSSRLMQARGLKPETEFVVVLNPGRASCRRVD